MSVLKSSETQAEALQPKDGHSTITIQMDRVKSKEQAEAIARLLTTVDEHNSNCGPEILDGSEPYLKY